MNLHGIVAPYVGAVNPLILVGIQVSVGNVTADDGGATPAYATPGAFTGAISGTVLTASAVANGVLQAGQAIGGAGVAAGTTITSQIDGAPGGAGTYNLNQPQAAPVSAEAMTTSLVALAQVQALTSRDLRQMEGLNLQGTMRAVYVNGDVNGVVRVLLKGGDLVTMPDGTVWLVTLVPEPWNMTAGWTKFVVTLQNGA